MTLDHMRLISQAMEAYLRAEGTYPTPAIYGKAGEPLLSWRVRLLPYLGYEALYQQFQRDKPWNHPHNQALLASIPSVYQSPERCDTHTNYLLPCGTTTPFSGQRGLRPQRWEDGAENTVILVEADDSIAVPWTEPRDLQVGNTQLAARLGGLRSDGFFAVFGGGRLARIPTGLDDRAIRGIFTIDGGEPMPASAMGEMATAELASAPSEPSATSSSIVQASANRLATSIDSSGNATSARSGGTARRTAAEFSAQARIAAEAGLEPEAIRYCHAAYLTGESGPNEWFRWIPGLRRPAIAVRLGIGLDYIGSDRQSLQRLLADDSNPNAWSRQRKELERIVGEMAPPVLQLLDSIPPFLPPPVSLAGPAQADAARAFLGPTFLGAADSSTLQQVARREGVDCLVLFVVEERLPRRSASFHVVSVNVIDVVGRRPLYEGPRISYLRRQQAGQDPLYEDPIPQVALELEELVTQKLRPQPIPAQLQPRHAARRVRQLSRTSGDPRLAALSEMRFYQRNDLISLQQLLTAFQTVLGTDPGLALLAGSPTAQREALAEWLPRIRSRPIPIPRRSDPDD